jgi:glycolate dehydrogenase FAD-linked subunit
MWRSRLQRKIEKIVGKDAVLAGEDLLRRYSWSAASDHPQLACLPTSAEEISQVLQVAAASKRPIALATSPNSVVGSYPANSLLIDLGRMNKVQEIDPDNLCAVLQPLADLSALKSELEPLGLSVRAGSHAVTALEVAAVSSTGMQLVLPNGRIANLGGKPQDALGYFMAPLFAVSGVALGIPTKVFLPLSRKHHRSGEGVFSARTAAPVERELLVRLGDALDSSKTLIHRSMPSAGKPA